MSRFVPFALLALVVAGCSFAVEPAADSRVLHVSNRSGNAILLQGANTTDRLTTLSTIVTSCGGTVDFDPSHNGLSFGDYEVAVLLDPTGALDAAIERANGNLGAVDTSTLSLPIFWSRSGLGIRDLPQWITVTPDGVILDGTGPPTGSVTPPCDPFSASPEPGPE